MEDEDPADKLLKWYRKQRESGAIPEPTPEERAEAEKTAARLLKWYRKQKATELVSEPGNNVPRPAEKLPKLQRKQQEQTAKPIRMRETTYKDVRGIKHFKEEKGQLIELGRLNFTASGMAHLYLPKRVCNLLKLDKEMDSVLVIVGVDENSLFLIKDGEMASVLKPRILDARKEAVRELMHRMWRAQHT